MVIEKMENRKNELSQLAKELERQMKNRYDVVVPTDKLIAVKDGESIKMDVSFYDKDTNLVKNRHSLTNWAHSQVSEKTGIPMRYYRKMLDEKKLDLLANNINTWIPSKEKRMVRVLDNKIRALLSDGYHPIDNYKVLFNTLEEVSDLKKNNGIDIDVKTANVTDTRMYVKFTSPDLSDDIMKFDNGKSEPVQGGIIISNSEVGNGAFAVQPFINVLVCQNGLISDRSLRRVHVGRKWDTGLVNWSDKTRELEDETLISKIKDMVSQTFDKKIFHSWVDDINGVASTEVPKPEIAIDNVVKHFDMPKARKESLLAEFTKNAPNTGNTQWGISMAVTRLAQDEENYDNRIQMEEIGAKILDKRLTPIILEGN